MDAKITKKRLGHLLSYDWLKIIAVSAGLILLWNLIFTTSETRITPAQNFTVFNYTGSSAGADFSQIRTKRKSIFSYDIFQVNATDATVGNETDTIMQARISTHEGDAVFVADRPTGKKQKFEGSEEEIEISYLQNFLTRYGYNIFSITGDNGILSQAETYLSPFYTDLTNAETLDTGAVERAFRARIKKLNDKRFKKDSEIKKGVKQEIARISLIYNNLAEFRSYLDEGYIAVETTTYPYELSKNGSKTTTAQTINLCPNAHMENLKNCVSYKEEVQEGEFTYQVPTAKNMHLVLLNVSGAKYKYSAYESLSYVNFLVRSYCDDLQN